MARASRILLVDDEMALLEITKELLEFTAASSIDTIISVQEALDKLRMERYDATISKYQMPGMNSLEFLRKVRESDTTIALVLFTGKGREAASEAIGSSADFAIKQVDEANAAFTNPVTDRKKAMDESTEAMNKLRLLSRITSHDIQNQLMVLSGLIQKARREHSPIVVRELLARMQGAADKIQTHLTFAREYQNLGRSPPVWQDIDTLVRDLASRFESKFIQFSIDAKGVEVYADLMLNRAFYNLIDNTLKHGQKASRIEVTASENDGSLLLSYRDDGVGVPVDRKRAIFEKREGNDGPQGLMLVSEILSITGIGIEEKGVPGQGAHFEMTVPRGSYRFSAKSSDEARFISSSHLGA